MLKVVVSGCGRYCLRNEDNEFKTLCSLCAVCEDFCNKQKYIPEHIREKVLYITNFETDCFNRNKGYATYLLKEVIELLKDEYDLIHLNACPYYIVNGCAIYETPNNGLDMDMLVKFYESFGFEVCGTSKEGFKIMVLKK